MQAIGGVAGDALSHDRRERSERRPISFLTLAFCTSTANWLADRCICVPMSCIAFGM